MPDNSKPSMMDDKRFEDVLADILLREEAGGRLDLSSVVRAYPDLESCLREYFCNREAFTRVADTVVPLPDLAPGSQFDGYEVVRQIDKGGRGAIYRVSDSELHRPLAIKVLLRELRGEPDA